MPHLEDQPAGTTLFEALAQQWPSYPGYVISFLQIGVIWANHHDRFRFITRSDHVLLFPSLLRAMTRRYVAGMVAYLLTFVLAFVNVTLSLALIVILALPEPDERAKPPRRREAR